MKIHHLEIVTLNVDKVCAAYEAAYNVRFDDADELLGGARTCSLKDGSIVGVRRPLRESEEPVVRPYWLVEDIEKAISLLKLKGQRLRFHH
ncbi:VOC family protein [Microbulbifer sp. DLAB2-AF]|uniref:VOC family protein n=1 Tax=Microbulbifer sp. DLAB2-AF TaxID=3243395 RepID=UPI0040396105